MFRRKLSLGFEQKKQSNRIGELYISEAARKRKLKKKME